MKIPFLSFEHMNETVKEEIYASFDTFFKSNWYVLGQQLRDFEAQYASFNKVAHCIGVGSGLDALIIALKALGVTEGDEVIVPSNTYIASVLSISAVGATPILVEPDRWTYNLDPEQVKSAVTSKTKAIMPVHLYGQACNMSDLRAIAQKHSLFVVEDNAQSQGATWQGEMTGSFGHVNATSFYPGKNLGAYGEAGAITTNNLEWAEKCTALRNYGSIKKYENLYKGFNSRMDEMQAGFLSVKLKYLHLWSEERRKIAQWYEERLNDLNQITLPYIDPKGQSVFHLFVVRLAERDQMKDYLQENGIGTMVHYPIPPHLQEAYRELGFQKGQFPIAEDLANTMLSLPMYIGMEESQVDYVCNSIKQYYA